MVVAGGGGSERLLLNGHRVSVARQKEFWSLVTITELYT